MYVNWKIIKPGSNPPNNVNAFIEIPRGSSIKYEVDHETGIIFVDRTLHTAFTYPFDYGIIPQTWYYDDDPVDIMVLSRMAIFPGCVVPTRPIGFVRMKDEAGIDNKILAVPAKDPFFEKIRDISDVPPSTLREIKHFLEHYKDLEPGKWVKVEEWDNADVAKREILKAIAMYKKKFGEGTL
ncbi:inorganic diphosphatase [Candidatus Bathyarchaeota archaeon]|jgi:inorganic pyrophosphatase|nr:MAG: inorganic diphosphatase [Candidatus Bathyarchaeota archaeon]